MSIRARLAQPSSLTSQEDPKEARLTGLGVVEQTLAGKAGHWPVDVTMAERHSHHSMGTGLAYSGSELEGLGTSLQAQTGRVTLLSKVTQ